MAQPADTPHIPLVQGVGSRLGSTSKDSLMVNMYAERDGQELYATKRPGLGLLKTMVTDPFPQALFNLDDNLWLLAGDTITWVAESGPSPGTHWAPRALPLVHTGDYADVTSDYYRVWAPARGDYTLLQSSTAVFFIPKNGLLPITRVVPQSSASTPANKLTPSICELNGTFYVMDTAGVIFGSALQDPLTWPALNFLQVDQDLGRGMALQRHLNYLVALGASGTQVLYDGGVSPGLPALPVPNAKSRLGCLAGRSVQVVEDLLLWVGTSDLAGAVVNVMEGLTISQCSPPAVERLLASMGPLTTAIDNNSNGVLVSAAFRVSGYEFYLLNVLAVGSSQLYSLVFEAKTRSWAIWQDALGRPLAGALPTFSHLGQQAVAATSTGIFTLSQDNYTDNGQTIPCTVRTSRHTWGTQKMKFYAATYLLADNAPATIAVRWSDDDFATWGSWRDVSAANTRKAVIGCGSAVQRAWEVSFSAPYPMRMQALEFDLQVGSA